MDTFSTAQLWNRQSGVEIKRVPYCRWQTALSFSADSAKVAFTGYDEFLDKLVIEILDTMPVDLVDKLCSQLGRNLSREEWREYFSGQTYRKTCPSLIEQTQK
jgi:hypothetical protein